MADFQYNVNKVIVISNKTANNDCLVPLRNDIVMLSTLVLLLLGMISENNNQVNVD